MCFSNIPVEFDERGNPYLADEADDVERPERTSGNGEPLEEDPEGAYAEIVASVPESVRESLADGDSDVDPGYNDEPDTARGD